MSQLRDIKIIRIGNSQGIRLPKPLLQKYGLDKELILEEIEEGILLRKPEGRRLSWEDTYREIAADRGERAEWVELDTALLDGIGGDEYDPE